MGSLVQRGCLCNGTAHVMGLFVQKGHLCNGAVCARGVCLCHGAARAPQALVQRGRWRSRAVEAVVVLVQGGLRVPQGRRCEGAAGAGGCLCSGVCIRPVQQGLGGAFWAPSPPRCRQAARLCPRYEGAGWGGSAEHPPSPRPAPFSPFPISWGQNDIPKTPKIHGRARPVPAQPWLPRGGLGAATGLEGGVSPRVPPNLPMHRGGFTPHPANATSPPRPGVEGNPWHPAPRTPPVPSPSPAPIAPSAPRPPPAGSGEREQVWGCGVPGVAGLGCRGGC